MGNSDLDRGNRPFSVFFNGHSQVFSTAILRFFQRPFSDFFQRLFSDLFFKDFNVFAHFTLRWVSLRFWSSPVQTYYKIQITTFSLKVIFVRLFTIGAKINQNMQYFAMRISSKVILNYYVLLTIPFFLKKNTHRLPRPFHCYSTDTVHSCTMNTQSKPIVHRNIGGKAVGRLAAGEPSPPAPSRHAQASFQARLPLSDLWVRICFTPIFP